MREGVEELFNSDDLRQMAELGIAPEEAARQVALFRDPPPYARVLRPCRPGDGIRTFAAEHEPELLAAFDELAREGRVAKLVPASGAASRMFKALLEDLNHGGAGEPSAEVQTFLESLPRFAFYEALAESMARDGLEISRADRGEILAHLLTERGLDYAELPKGLLLFHRYDDGPRTAFEEHLVESAELARDAHGICRLCFTVSPQHEERFEALLAAVRDRYQERFGCCYEVSFSQQRRSTDTIAVGEDDRPFRLEDGSLLFRPGGHGALIENLHDLGVRGWDVVLLKNIDNVVQDARKPLVNRWKRLLGGCLARLRQRAFELLDRLEAGDEAALAEAERFAHEELSRPFSHPPSREELIAALDRPIRVCGLVRNQGEPGGGPFWVADERGELSLQIVETSQIDPDRRRELLAASTHFSPVDIACGLRDRHGRPYDLRRHVDPAAVFIAAKSHEGRPLKALERPGLWNGAMAGWNTVFVEVPDETFAPVKTVLDLLRPEHQPG
jgi:hypothetical protein